MDGRFRRLVCRARSDDRGAGSAELVVAMPLLMLLLLMIVQFTLWMHATHIAQAAAAEALAATRVDGGSVADGESEAQRVLGQLGSGPLRTPHTTVLRGPDRAVVDIQGSVTAIVPFVELTARGHAAGPLEYFHPDQANR